jgi:hypothetical protein
MARKFLTALDLSKNELQNAVVQNLASAPSAPVKGQLYFDSTGNVLYWWNGTAWVAAQGSAGAVPATTVTTSAVGDTGVVGTATTYAREDHKHSRESFGAVAPTTVYGQASSNGVSINVARSDHVHGSPNHGVADHSPFSLSIFAVPTADVSMGLFKLTNLADPVAVRDATNKQYVDNLINGAQWKAPVVAATTANITLSGGGQIIDGVTIGVSTAVLVKNQTTASQNGIYMSAAGAWVRRTDMDLNAEVPNAAVFVQQGTTQADTAWVCTNDNTVALGTTAITFVQFGASSVGVTDGDKTDITVSGGGATWTIDADAVTTTKIINAAVTNAKLANMTQPSIKGRWSSGGGPPEDLSVAQVAALLGGLYLARVSAYNTAAATTTVCAHNYGTRDVAVEVYRSTTPWDRIDCDVERTDTNNVTVRFAVATAASEYRIVITG